MTNICSYFNLAVAQNIKYTNKMNKIRRLKKTVERKY